MFQPCQRQWLPVSNLAIVNQARNRVLSFSVLLVTMCVDLANSHSDSSFCLSYAGLDNCQGLHKLTGLDICQGLHKLTGLDIRQGLHKLAGHSPRSSQTRWSG